MQLFCICGGSGRACRKTDVYEQQLQQELFTGQVEHLERKDVINMTVSQVLDSNINIEGDEFLRKLQMRLRVTKV